MIAQKCPCVNNAPQNAGFCALSPSFPPLRALCPPTLAFCHRTLFAPSAPRMAPSPLRRPLCRAPPHAFPAPPRTLLPCVLSRAPPRAPAPPRCRAGRICRVPCRRAAAPMSGRIRRFPCRRVPPRFAPALHISSKEQNPCARGAGVSSHCHVMFRRRLTPRRGRCKQAHRRRASWLQARSQPSTHPW